MKDFKVVQGKGSDFTVVNFGENVNTWHSNPQDAKKRIFGRALQPGEVLQKGEWITKLFPK